MLTLAAFSKAVAAKKSCKHQTLKFSRLVQSSENDCLDPLEFFGTGHLDYLSQEYLEHDHSEHLDQAFRIKHDWAQTA